MIVVIGTMRDHKLITTSIANEVEGMELFIWGIDKDSSYCLATALIESWL